jgi:hypothetical protein
MVFEIVKTVLYQPLTRVSYIESFALADFVEYHEVILIPVQDAGKRGKRQIVNGRSYAD